MEYVKEKENQILIKGLQQTQHPFRAFHIAKRLHEKLPQQFLKPIFNLYDLSDWTDVSKELIRLLDYRTINENVAIFLNDQYIGGEYDLLRAVGPHCVYLPDLGQLEKIDFSNQMLLYGLNPKRTCIFLEIGVDNQPFGRLVYEIYSDFMPMLTKKFIYLCSNEPKKIRRELNPEYTSSQESMMNNDTERILDVDDPEGATDRMVGYLTYADTLITRIVSPSFIQGGIVRGVDDEEWLDGDSEPDVLSHNCNGDLSLMATDSNLRGHRKFHSSQFVISLQPNPWMDGLYRCIGRLISGQHVLNVIRDVPTYRQQPMQYISVTDCGIMHKPTTSYFKPEMEEKDSDSVAAAVILSKAMTGDREKEEKYEDVDEEEIIYDDNSSIEEEIFKYFEMEDEIWLKGYEQFLETYCQDICDLQSRLHDGPPLKELNLYYKVKDEDESTFWDFDTQSVGDSMIYKEMEAVHQDTPLRLTFNLKVNNSIYNTEILGDKLYQLMNSVELIRPDEIFDDHAPFIQEDDTRLTSDIVLQIESSVKEFAFGEESMFEELGEIEIASEVKHYEFIAGEEEMVMIEEGEMEENIIEEEEMSSKKSTASPDISWTGRSELSPDKKSSLSLSEQPSFASEEKPESEAEEVKFSTEMSVLMEQEELFLEEDMQMEHSTYELPDYVTPQYLLEQAHDEYRIPKEILEYIFKCVFKLRRYPKLDEEMARIMQSEDFKDKLLGLPSETLRNIAAKMEGVETVLQELDSVSKTEEQRKLEDQVISSSIATFTQNMLECYLRESEMEEAAEEFSHPRSEAWVFPEDIEDEITREEGGSILSEESEGNLTQATIGSERSQELDFSDAEYEAKRQSRDERSQGVGTSDIEYQPSEVIEETQVTSERSLKSKQAVDNDQDVSTSAKSLGVYEKPDVPTESKRSLKSKEAVDNKDVTTSAKSLAKSFSEKPDVQTESKFSEGIGKAGDMTTTTESTSSKGFTDTSELKASSGKSSASERSEIDAQESLTQKFQTDISSKSEDDTETEPTETTDPTDTPSQISLMKKTRKASQVGFSPDVKPS